jgi:hypothetical protein
MRSLVLIYGVKALDAARLLDVAIVLTLVSATAGFLSALRATGVPDL